MEGVPGREKSVQIRRGGVSGGVVRGLQQVAQPPGEQRPGLGPGGCPPEQGVSRPLSRLQNKVKQNKRSGPDARRRIPRSAPQLGQQRGWGEQGVQGDAGEPHPAIM